MRRNFDKLCAENMLLNEYAEYAEQMIKYIRSFEGTGLLVDYISIKTFEEWKHEHN